MGGAAKVALSTGGRFGGYREPVFREYARTGPEQGAELARYAVFGSAAAYRGYCVGTALVRPFGGPALQRRLSPRACAR